MKKWNFILLPIILLTACGETDPKEVNFILSEIGEVDFHSEEQNAFWADQNVEKSLLNYGMGEESKELPKPIKLNWKVPNAKQCIVKISENEDMSDSWSFVSKKKSFDLFNCKTGTKYFWTVSATYKSNTFTSSISSFVTKSGGPRNLYVEGVNNIRDIGGYLTNDGKTINQGLIYRSAKMNESDVKVVKNTITSSGIDVMLNQLNIKTDIDLRKNELDDDGVNEIGGLTSSPLGESVNYINCPMYFEGTAVIGHTNKTKDAFNKESIKEMFEILGDKNNYPVVFHCTQGKDRTGALAYLMETLLNINLSDIQHDYLFTNMSKIGGYCNYKMFNNFDYYLLRQEGNNLCEKAYNYLLSIGVDSTSIDNFISIMKG